MAADSAVALAPEHCCHILSFSGAAFIHRRSELRESGSPQLILRYGKDTSLATPGNGVNRLPHDSYGSYTWTGAPILWKVELTTSQV